MFFSFRFSMASDLQSTLVRCVSILCYPRGAFPCVLRHKEHHFNHILSCIGSLSHCVCTQQCCCTMLTVGKSHISIHSSCTTWLANNFNLHTNFQLPCTSIHSFTLFLQPKCCFRELNRKFPSTCFLHTYNLKNTPYPRLTHRFASLKLRFRKPAILLLLTRDMKITGFWWPSNVWRNTTWQSVSWFNKWSKRTHKQ